VCNGTKIHKLEFAVRYLNFVAIYSRLGSIYLNFGDMYLNGGPKFENKSCRRVGGGGWVPQYLMEVSPSWWGIFFLSSL